MGPTRADGSRSDALAAFAQDELGLSLDALLGAWGGAALDTLAEHAEALDAAEPDGEELALLGQVLGIAWRRQGLNDRTVEVDDELRARSEAAQWRTHDRMDD